MHFHLGCVCHAPHCPQKFLERNIIPICLRARTHQYNTLLVCGGWWATRVGSLHSLELEWSLGLPAEVHPTLLSSHIPFILWLSDLKQPWNQLPLHPTCYGRDIPRVAALWAPVASTYGGFCTSRPVWRLLTSACLASGYSHPATILRS